MSRLPLRLRLTLVFALAMAAVLAATGAFVYVRVGDSLDDRVDDGLRSRATALAASVEGGTTGRALPGGEEEFAQLLGPRGDLQAATPGFGEPIVGDPGSREAFLETTVTPPGEGEAVPFRILVRPVSRGRTAVVGTSLEDRDEALEGLLAQLLIGGLLALALASTAGYALAGAALRPVEAMRRRAAAITAQTSGERLPVPVARDELHRLATTLNGMLDRLDAGLRRERQFVADASHELRTPLALLRAEVDLALRRPRSHEELEQALRSVSTEVDRLGRLAEDLLVLAAAEEGRMRLRPSEFSVRDLLETVAGRFAGSAEELATRVEVGEVPKGEMTADRIRLEQALGNVVDNALRHGTGPVRLDATRGNGMLVLRVRDEGPGFPPEFLPNAFDRFARADDARSVGGVGLGLAIVDAIARAHGGRAGARNVPGGGAEISLEIPQSPAPRGDSVPP